jgi:ubiquinone/menaquinone biosynthesis C-methylase UbiE
MTHNQGYYDEKLSASRLKRCYEIAPPRVKQYLQAEMDHVLTYIKPSDKVLDLGCGYGRTLGMLSGKAGRVVGIDTSMASLRMAQPAIINPANSFLAQMNAVHLGFAANSFDMVICIQNGISAFKVDRLELIRESIRVIRPGGKALFSTYAEKFWPDRLHWFELQAQEGLLGDIDYTKTGNGVIICVDGFKATTVTPDEFLSLASSLNLKTNIIEVDKSSLFYEIEVE